MTIPVVSIVGRTNSGKTTLIERLIPELRARGYRVGTVKHHHHGDFEADTPGKDSWRHARAGAAAVALSSRARLAVFKSVEKEPSLDEIVARYLDGMDIVLTEGFKEGEKPKIEVVRRARGEPPLCTDRDHLVALATDDVPHAVQEWGVKFGVPVFALDAPAAIADFVEGHFLRNGPGGRSEVPPNSSPA